VSDDNYWGPPSENPVPPSENRTPPSENPTSPPPAPQPYGLAPSGQPPYGQAPYGQAPYGQAPYGQAPYGQAPYGQAPHGQAPFVQPGHAQSNYGQPGHAQSNYGQPGYGPPTYSARQPNQSGSHPGAGFAVVAPGGSESRVRTGFIIAGVVALVLLVPFAIVFVKAGLKNDSSSSGPNRVLVLPKSSGGYELASGQVNDRLVAQMRSSIASFGGSKLLDNAKIGIYDGPARERMIVIGLDDAGSGSTVGLRPGQTEIAVESFIAVANVGTNKDFDAGPLGGTLQCGHPATTGENSGGLRVCGWADTTTGAMIELVGVKSDAAAAQVVAQLRKDSEH